ncbi:CIPK9 [Symbiodinium natans]|uniref:CIPK9 protein n=1 Tax=Symbiodinium natans TaxID=878477 RepID=A0A812MGS7_9DINO|nr:CIPK9 [Symbiodinium natans]
MPEMPKVFKDVVDVFDDGYLGLQMDFGQMGRHSFPIMEPGRFSLDHVLRPSDEGTHAQIEVLVDHSAGCKRVVAKRFPRAYLRDDPISFRESPAGTQSSEDPWTELFLSLKLGQEPARMRGVVPCQGVYRDSQEDVLLLLEWVSGGDLFDLASNLGEPGPQREATAAHVLCSLLEVVTRLHARGIAHGDISAENAIIRTGEGEGEVALLDFAMAIHDTDLSAVTGARGKLMYRAPETLGEGAIYDARAADLFACGMVGYVLATGTYPWQSTAPDCKAFSYVRQHGMKRFLDKRTIAVGPAAAKVSISRILSAGYQALLVSLLDPNPRKRLAFLSQM